MSAAGAALVGAASAQVDDFPVQIAWSPDGQWLVVGGGEGCLYRVQAADGAVHALGEHAPGLIELAWQPKGALLVTGGQDGAVRAWQPGAPDAAPQLWHRAPRWPAGLCWRADGTQLAFASGRDVHVRDAAGGEIRVLAGHGVPLTHVAFRGRDELIAVGNGALFVDRVDSGQMEQFVLEGTPQTLALSPDLKIAATGLADGTINFRYVNQRKRSRMSGYEGKVHLTAWSANSRWLATGSTGASSVVVWDFGGKGPEGSDPLQLNAHEDRVEALAWQPNGPLMASAGRDWRVVLWRPGPGSRSALDIQLLDGPAGAMAWSADGRRLAVAQPSGRIRFFSLRAA